MKDIIQGAVNSTGYFSRGPGFNSKHPHGGSKSFVIPGPGDLMFFSGYNAWMHRHAGRHTSIHIPIIKYSSLRFILTHVLLPSLAGSRTREILHFILKSKVEKGGMTRCS